jgi:hypothetical protein
VTAAVSNSASGIVRGLSVRTRIYFGFGMLLLLSAGLAIFSVTQLGSIGSEVDRSTTLTANTETGSASSQVLSSAQSLSTESNRLKLEVGKFLATVRAA